MLEFGAIVIVASDAAAAAATYVALYFFFDKCIQLAWFSGIGLRNEQTISKSQKFNRFAFGVCHTCNLTMNSYTNTHVPE